jgi:hypothetical protein
LPIAIPNPTLVADFQIIAVKWPTTPPFFDFPASKS